MPFLPPAPFSPVYAPPAPSSGSYFAPTYYAPSYFAPTYFPDAAPAAPPSPPSAATPLDPFQQDPFRSPGGIPLSAVAPPASFAVSLNGDRFRLGDAVMVAFTAPAQPASPPLASVVSAPGSVVLAFPVPLSRLPLFFSYAFRVPAGTPLGKFSVAASFETASGVTYTGAADFELVGGGDSGGRVISLFAVGSHMIAHLDGGKLVQGSNPRV